MADEDEGGSFYDYAPAGAASIVSADSTEASDTEYTSAYANLEGSAYDQLVPAGGSKEAKGSAKEDDFASEDSDVYTIADDYSYNSPIGQAHSVSSIYSSNSRKQAPLGAQQRTDSLLPSHDRCLPSPPAFSTFYLPKPASLRSLEFSETVFDKYFWSASFHEIHQRYANLVHQGAQQGENDEVLDVYFRLSAHAEDFSAMAEKYAKIIISEKYIHVDKKTIKPAKDIAGVAGGLKHVCQGILLKFALDNLGIYGSDDNAIKAAGHDLRGLTLYYQCNIPGLFVPLMSLIDYKGFRVLAISLLPISDSTLKYGSANGGRTVHADGDQVTEKMREAAKILNLQAHLAGPASQLKEVYSACDMEGHLMKDGKLVLIDFARAVPPEPPTKCNRGAIFYRMLRPELVRKSPVPLSADAFSKFEHNDPQRKVHSQHVTDIWKMMVDQLIPQFAKSLVEREPALVALWKERQSNITDPDLADRVVRESDWLLRELHTRGINYRHLNLLRFHLLQAGSKLWVRYVIAEMVARTVKVSLNQILRESMQNLNMPSEEVYRKIAVEYINAVFGTNAASSSYWRVQMPQCVHLKYCYLIYENDDSATSQSEVKGNSMKLFCNCRLCNAFSSCARTDLDRWLLFQRLQRILTLKFSTSAVQELNSDEAFETERPFADSDIVALIGRVKNMPIIDKGKAFMLYKQAKNSRDSMARSLLRGAIQRFEGVANTLPDSLTFHAWANSLLSLAKLTTDSATAVRFIQHSFTAYKRVAAGFSAKNSSNWKEALDEMERRIDANPDWQRLWEAELEQWFKIACGKSDSDPAALLELADIIRATQIRLIKQNPTSNDYNELEPLMLVAISKYKRALALQPKLVEAQLKLGSLLVERAVLHTSSNFRQYLLRFAKVIFRQALASRSTKKRQLRTASLIRELWFPSTFREVQRYPKGTIRALHSPILAGDILLSIADDCDFEAWDLAVAPGAPGTRFVSGGQAKAKLIDRCGDVLFAVGDTSVRVWSLALVRRVIRSALQAQEAKAEAERSSGAATAVASIQSSTALIKTLGGHESIISTVATCQELGYLFVASKDTIRIWNISSSVDDLSNRFKLVTKFKIPGLDAAEAPTVRKIATLGTNLLVAVGGASIQVWDIKNLSNIVHKQTVALYQKKKQNIGLWNLSCSQQGRLFVSDNRNHVKVFDVSADGTLVKSEKPKLKLGDSFYRWTAVYSDFLLGVAKTILLVFDARTLNQVLTMELHEDNISDICLAHEGQLLSRANDKNSSIWSTLPCNWLDRSLSSDTTKRTCPIMRPSCLETTQSSGLFNHVVNSTHTSLKHGVTFVGCAAALLVWSFSDQKLLQTIDDAHSDFIVSLALTPDENHLFTGSYDGTIKFWRYQQGGLQLKGSINAHKGKVRSIRLIGQRLYSGGADGMIQVWEPDSLADPKKIKNVTSFKAYSSSVLTLNEFKGCLITGGSDGMVKFWELANHKLLASVQATQKRAGVSAMSTRYSLLFIGEVTKYKNLVDFQKRGINAQHDIHVFDLSAFPSVSLKQTLPFHVGSVLDIAPTDHFLLSTGRDNAITSLQTLTQVHQLKRSSYVNSVEVVGSFLICAVHNCLFIYTDQYYARIRALMD